MSAVLRRQAPLRSQGNPAGDNTEASGRRAYQIGLSMYVVLPVTLV